MLTLQRGQIGAVTSCALLQGKECRRQDWKEAFLTCAVRKRCNRTCSIVSRDWDMWHKLPDHALSSFRNNVHSDAQLTMIKKHFVYVLQSSCFHIKVN